MITKQTFNEIVAGNVKLVEKFFYAPYGEFAYVLDAWSDETKWSAQLIFDAVTDEVVFVGVYDYANARAYCLLGDNTKELHDQYAWDEVEYIRLDEDEDFIEKALAIANGKEYDTRVSIPLDIPDDELLVLFKLAHEMDITFNQLIERALEQEINRLSV